MTKIPTCIMIICIVVGIGVMWYHRRPSSIAPVNNKTNDTITKDIIVFKLINTIRLLLKQSTQIPYSSYVLQQSVYLNHEELLDRKRQYLESMTLNELKHLDFIDFVKQVSSTSKEYDAATIKDFEGTLRDSKNITMNRIMADYTTIDNTLNTIISECVNKAVNTNADAFNEQDDTDTLRREIANIMSKHTNRDSGRVDIKAVKGSNGTLITY